MNSRVFVGGLEGSNYLDQIKKGLSFIRFGDHVDANKRLFIKPNLMFPKYRPGVMTSPAAIEAAVAAIKNYTNMIRVGDADSGGYNRFSMSEVYDKIAWLLF